MAINLQNTDSYCEVMLDWSGLYLYSGSYERMDYVQEKDATVSIE